MIGPRPSRIVVIGLGYSARYAARRLRQLGWIVTGTARTRQGADALCAAGFRGLLFDGRHRSEALAVAIASASHVLASAPPGPAGDPGLDCHRDDLEAAADVGVLLYLSTIGVYGDHGGRWIDETVVPSPQSDRSRRRLEAEMAWLQLAGSKGCRGVVLRLPAIYGPGRSTIDRLRAGTVQNIAKPGQYFNRIHVEDLASAIVAALVGPTAGTIYNIADDEPAAPGDVVEHAARLLGLPPPPAVPLAQATLTTMAASFWAESKRIANRRMKQELGVELAYPSYREGLAAIAASEARA